MSARVPPEVRRELMLDLLPSVPIPQRRPKPAFPRYATEAVTGSLFSAERAPVDSLADLVQSADRPEPANPYADVTQTEVRPPPSPFGLEVSPGNASGGVVASQASGWRDPDGEGRDGDLSDETEDANASGNGVGDEDQLRTHASLLLALSPTNSDRKTAAAAAALSAAIAVETTSNDEKRDVVVDSSAVGGGAAQAVREEKPQPKLNYTARARVPGARLGRPDGRAVADMIAAAAPAPPARPGLATQAAGGSELSSVQSSSRAHARQLAMSAMFRARKRKLGTTDAVVRQAKVARVSTPLGSSGEETSDSLPRV